jgi:hypothetical protein
MTCQQEDQPGLCHVHVLATFAPLLWLKTVYRNTACKFRTYSVEYIKITNINPDPFLPLSLNRPRSLRDAVWGNSPWVRSFGARQVCSVILQLIRNILRRTARLLGRLSLSGKDCDYMYSELSLRRRAGRVIHIVE